MNKQISMHVFRVFVNPEGEYGNPVEIVVDDKQEISASERQSIAAKAGFTFCEFSTSATVKSCIWLVLYSEI